MPRAPKARDVEKPAFVVERVPLEQLHADPRNARAHDTRNLDAITASLERFGQVEPLVARPDGTVIGGNGRLSAMSALGWTHANVVRVDLEDNEATALGLALNRTAELATWNDGVLAELLRDLEGGDLADVVGFSAAEVDELVAAAELREKGNVQDAGPQDVLERTVSRVGDLWTLGTHRVLCGDSTSAGDVARLMGEERAALVHADPPYGMGKEADGIANDNLYEEKLDRFQMAWWRTWRAHVLENASAYVWGNAPDLWRLWYRGGFADEPGIVFRNEIVWDKGSGFGMTSAGAHSFPPGTERCLFVMLGQQFLGNQNKDEYWEGYEPLRSWLVAERDKAGWTNGDVNRITGTAMSGHWFGKSQFAPISRAQYELLQREAAGVAFVETYDELFERCFPEAKAGGNAHRRELGARLRESRTFFDNTHDAMTDVWQFGRVTGEERFGHATPKPVAMIGRAIASSCPAGEIVAEPFLGTGTTLIAAEQLGRRCFAMELEPAYVDTAIRRWEITTGELAMLDGKTFAQVELERSAAPTQAKARKRRR